jgi:hypothetical protein
MMGKGGKKMERYTNALVLVPSGTALTSAGNSATFDVSRFTEGLILINVSAVSGTSPSLQFYVETYDPVNNLWFQLPGTMGQPAAITSAGSTVIQLNNFGRTVRLRWTVSGTGASFTLSAVFVSKS